MHELLTRFRFTGSLCVFTRTDVACQKEDRMEDNAFDLAWFKICLQDEPLFLCCIYRSLNDIYFPRLFQYLGDKVDSIQTHHPVAEIIVLGDFNVHNTNWLRHSNRTDDAGRPAEILAISHILTQLVYEPTRIPDHPTRTPWICFLISDPDDFGVKTNNWQCKLLTSLWQYFTMANYSWILMEGLYLYNLIFRALFTDSNGSILGYVIMGWGIPFLVVSPWILARIFKEDTLCWTTTSSKIHLIIEIPTFISNIVNLIFFVRISSVLLKKLKSPLNDDNRKCYMKWAKSTLVLVPLFGINYVLLLGLKYIKNEVVELVWIAGDSLFGSFQGFFAAVLYCFLNGEVKTEIKPFLSTILPYLASSRLFGICFPCKEMFIRPTRGRISICTTLSCSSMYTNGLMHTRCSNSRNKDAHRCQHMKRLSQDAVTSDSAGTSVNMSLNRKQTCLHKMGTHDTSLEISDIEMKQSLEEYSFMLPRQC
ncbi:hypothetical protein HHI36_019559 [Cryptolaemus montrouzieri]|uniref:G-protein coupled receptors family 2 profile 2 domain-containing protein n=1 Tax=Cryptolaemus montrouzieri TaxID=559131 RepID=A0ABD2N8W2_9CUCU